MFFGSGRASKSREASCAHRALALLWCCAANLFALSELALPMLCSRATHLLVLADAWLHLDRTSTPRCSVSTTQLSAHTLLSAINNKMIQSSPGSRANSTQSRKTDAP